MRYTLVHSTESLEPHYMGEGKSDPSQMFRSEVNDTYSLTSDEEFDKTVKAVTDAPDEELTEENFDGWWGPLSGSGEGMGDDANKRIIRYYNGRRDLLARISSDVDSFRKGSDRIFTRNYDVQEGSLWFSTRDTDEYSPMLSRETIWIAIERT